jgi:hypothetical protein
VLIDEEKQVDAPELERADMLHDEVREEEGLATHEVAEQEEAEEMDAEAAVEVTAALHGRVLAAMRDILDESHVNVGQLGLPDRDERALLALQAAISGKSADLGTFLYASERIEQLEGALAVLQPSLVESGKLELGGATDVEMLDLIEQVGRVREGLKSLEDA